ASHCEVRGCGQGVVAISSVLVRLAHGTVGHQVVGIVAPVDVNGLQCGVRVRSGSVEVGDGHHAVVAAGNLEQVTSVVETLVVALGYARLTFRCLDGHRLGAARCSSGDGVACSVFAIHGHLGQPVARGVGVGGAGSGITGGNSCRLALIAEVEHVAGDG